MPTLTEIAQQALAETNQRTLRQPAEVRQPVTPGGQETAPPATLGEQFQSGLTTGVQGSISMVHGLRAIAAQALGEDPTDALEDMRYRDEIVQRETQGIETFEEFLAEPTLGGFLDQVAFATGEMAPSIASSIVTGGSGALVGGLAATVGKQALKRGARVASKKLLADELAKKARGEALDEGSEDVLELAYQGLRRSVAARRPDIKQALVREGSTNANVAAALTRESAKRGAKVGAVAGAAAGEYPLIAGSLGAEAFEASGEEGPSRTAAVGAMLAGAPLAAAGGAADFLVFSQLAKLAKRRAVAEGRPSNIFLDTIVGAAKGAGMASAVEGFTEAVQETGAVAFREAVDPGYIGREGEKPLLRIGEAAFKGAAGSIVAGGAGGGIARIIPKARELIDQAQRGNFKEDGTAAEPARDVQAQIESIERPEDAKETGYFAPNTVDSILTGENIPDSVRDAFQDATANPNTNVRRGDTMYRAIEENGRTAVAVAFAGDSGSPAAERRAQALEAFARGPNDTAAQATFLGHREQITDGSVLVSVRNPDGSIRHQTAVQPENAAETQARLRRDFPGAEVVTEGAEDVLTERASRVAEQGTLRDEQTAYRNLTPQLRAGAARVYGRLQQAGIDPAQATDEQLAGLPGVGEDTAAAFRTSMAAGRAFTRDLIRGEVEPPAAPVDDVPAEPADDIDTPTIVRQRLASIGAAPPGLLQVLESIENDPDIKAMRLDTGPLPEAEMATRQKAMAGLTPLLHGVTAPVSVRREREASMRQIAGRYQRATRPETRRRLKGEFIREMRQARFDEAMDQGGAAAVFHNPANLRIGIGRIMADEGYGADPNVETNLLRQLYGQEAESQNTEEGFHVEQAPAEEAGIDEADPTEGDALDRFELGFDEQIEGYAAKGDQIVDEQSFHRTEWARGENVADGWAITTGKFSGVPDDMRAKWDSLMASLSPDERRTFEAHQDEMSQAMVETLVDGPVAKNAGKFLFEVRKEHDPVRGREVLRLYRRATHVGDSAVLATERYLGRVTRRLRASASRPNALDPATNSGLIAVTPDGEMLPLHRRALMGMAENGSAMNTITDEALRGNGLSRRQQLKQGFLRSWKELQLRDWRLLREDGEAWDPSRPQVPPPEIEPLEQANEQALNAYIDAKRAFEDANPRARVAEIEGAAPVAAARQAYEQARVALSRAGERVAAQKRGTGDEDTTLAMPLAYEKASGRTYSVQDLLVDTVDPYPAAGGHGDRELQTKNGLPLGDFRGLKDEGPGKERNEAELKLYAETQSLVRAQVRGALLDAGYEKDDLDVITPDIVVYDRDEPLSRQVVDTIAEHYDAITRGLPYEDTPVAQRAMQFFRNVRRAHDERQREQSQSIGAWLMDNPGYGAGDQAAERTSRDRALLEAPDQPSEELVKLRSMRDRFADPQYADRIPQKTRQAFFNALENAEKEEANRVARRAAAEINANRPTRLSNDPNQYRPVQLAWQKYSRVLDYALQTQERMFFGEQEMDTERLAELFGRASDMKARIGTTSRRVGRSLAVYDPQDESAEIEPIESRDDDYLLRKYISTVPDGQRRMRDFRMAEENLEKIQLDEDASPDARYAAQQAYDRAALQLPPLYRSLVDDFQGARHDPAGALYQPSLDKPDFWERDEKTRASEIRQNKLNRARRRLQLLDQEAYGLRQSGAPVPDQLNEARAEAATTLQRLQDEQAGKAAPTGTLRRVQKSRVRAHDLQNEVANRIVNRFREEVGDGLRMDINVVTAQGMKGRFDSLDSRTKAKVGKVLEDLDGGKAAGFTLFGRNSATIILHDLPKTDVARGPDFLALQSLTLGHELGHVLFRNEMDRLSQDGKPTEQGRRLWNEYREKVGSAGQYTRNLAGFEEWYSDQVGAYLTGKAPADLSTATKSYFKRVADRIMLWLTRVGRQIVGARFDPNEAAQRFISEGLRAYRDPRSSRQLVAGGAGRNLQDAKLVLDVEKAVKAAAPANLNRLVKEGWNSGSTTGVKKLLYPANAHLREASPALADFFAARSQTATPTGFHDKVAHDRNKMMFDVAAALDIKNPNRMNAWHAPDIEAAMFEAEDELKRTSDLTGKPKALRDFLEGVYDAYLPQSLRGNKARQVGRRKNYFPRQLAVDYLEGSSTARQDLASLIRQFAPDAETAANAEEIVRSIVEDGFMVDGISMENDGGLRPGMSARNARGLAFVPTRALREMELVVPPVQALTSYIHHVTSLKHFEEGGGSKFINEKLADIEPSRRAAAERNVRGQLGLLNVGLAPGWRKFNAAAHALTAWTTLAFSVFGSLGEPVAAMLRANGTVKFGEFAKQLVRTATESENRELAQAIGVVAPEAMETVFGSIDAMTDVSQNLQRSMSFFFRATGLSAITQYTRHLSAGMGREFMLNAAKAPNEERNRRYLEVLGIDAAEVNAWDKAGRPMGNERINNAIARYVDEASVRPTPGSRPALGNDPRFRAIYALKSFNYDFGVRFLSGMGREVTNLVQSGRYGPAGYILLLAAGLMLPVAIVGLEAREWLKWGIRGGLGAVGVDTNPEMAFRSDRMGGLEYAVEILDRSGLIGPFAIATSVGEAMAMGRNPVVSQVPIADLVAEVLNGNYDRAVPVVSNAL